MHISYMYLIYVSHIYIHAYIYMLVFFFCFYQWHVHCKSYVTVLLKMNGLSDQASYSPSSPNDSPILRIGLPIRMVVVTPGFPESGHHCNAVTSSHRAILSNHGLLSIHSFCRSFLHPPLFHSSLLLLHRQWCFHSTMTVSGHCHFEVTCAPHSFSQMFPI